ncbi:hypothetical protein BD311DRAFT_599212, partial [Dichomitus squalens]
MTLSTFVTRAHRNLDGKILNPTRPLQNLMLKLVEAESTNNLFAEFMAIVRLSPTNVFLDGWADVEPLPGYDSGVVVSQRPQEQV